MDRTDADGCWLWTGAKSGDGYGSLRTKQGTRSAHRLAWELTHGPIADGMFVCHRCDVPLCVRPDHLFLGTPKENVRDAYAKDRVPLGEGRANSVLTEAQVREMRDRCRAGGVTIKELALSFQINSRTCQLILSGKRWGHVPGALPKRWSARLTDDVVLDLRRRYLAGARMKDLAREIGVGADTCRKAIRGQTWAHVPGAVPINVRSRRAT